MKVLLRYGGRAGRSGRYPMLQGRGGALATSTEEADKIVLDHFAAIEDAVVMDVSQLAQGYNARLHHSPEEVDLDPQLVISRAQVASLFSQ
eukprot:9079420-Pyramimonas_sp.AAC.1